MHALTAVDSEVCQRLGITPEQFRRHNPTPELATFGAVASGSVGASGRESSPAGEIDREALCWAFLLSPNATDEQINDRVAAVAWLSELLSMDSEAARIRALKQTAADVERHAANLGIDPKKLAALDTAALTHSERRILQAWRSVLGVKDEPDITALSARTLSDADEEVRTRLGISATTWRRYAD
jgi:hypothetical protein